MGLLVIVLCIQIQECSRTMPWWTWKNASEFMTSEKLQSAGGEKINYSLWRWFTPPLQNA